MALKGRYVSCFGTEVQHTRPLLIPVLRFVTSPDFTSGAIAFIIHCFRVFGLVTVDLYLVEGR